MLDRDRVSLVLGLPGGRIPEEGADVFLQVGRGGRVTWALLAAIRRFLAGE